MRLEQISNARLRHSINLKQRIARNRRRAKFVGLLYLLGTIILTALACLPLLAGNVAFKMDSGAGMAGQLYIGAAGVIEFFGLEVSTSTPVGFTMLVCAILYAAMLLGLIINVFRSFGKLKWLFKKKASRTYGFNRNVYAMVALSERFAGTLTSVLSFHLIICMLCGGEAAPTDMLLIALVVGIVIHFLCGFIGGKAKLFHIEVGYGITEQERDTSRLVPLFRSFLQIASALAIAFFFLQATTLGSFIPAFYDIEGVLNMFSTDMMALISFVVQIILLICVISLIARAVSSIEFDIEGRFADGIPAYRWRSFFTFLFAVGVYVCRMALGETVFTGDSPSLMYEVEFLTDTGVLIVAAIALVMFVIELILRKHPRTPEEKGEIADTTQYNPIVTPADEGDVRGAERKRDRTPVDTSLSDDVDLDYYFDNCILYPGLYYSGYEKNNGYVHPYANVQNAYVPSESAYQNGYAPSEYAYYNVYADYPQNNRKV